MVDQTNVDTGLLERSARDGFVNAARHFGLKVDDPGQFVKA